MIRSIRLDFRKLLESPAGVQPAGKILCSVTVLSWAGRAVCPIHRARRNVVTKKTSEHSSVLNGNRQRSDRAQLFVNDDHANLSDGRADGDCLVEFNPSAHDCLILLWGQADV